MEKTTSFIPMPLGISDFPTLRERGCYFVDKTHVIRDLYTRRHMVTLFTRPRRFGKTLTLSMIASFFDITKKDRVQELFAGTTIADDAEMMKEAGTRPVVMISLKDVTEATPDRILRLLGMLVSMTYKSYDFLLNDNCLSNDEKKIFQRILANKAQREELALSVKLLTTFLHRYYGKRPILFIDEYDAPIQCAWEHHCYDEVMSFFRPFFSSAFKDNPSLDSAVLTGVLRIAKESIFSGLNNLVVSSVLSGGYRDAFGFTKEEVTLLSQKLGYTDKLSELAEWYDGYNFQGIEIYNPWSVLNYFDQDCKPRAYWMNTSSNSILHDLLTHADRRRYEEIDRLMKGGSIVTPLTDGIIYQNIGAMRTALWSVMLYTGYLKCTETMDEDELPQYVLSIPNHEIRSVYRTEILQSLDDGTGNTEAALYDMLQAMITGDTALFEENLQDLLLRSMSYHDTAKTPEAFYHGLMLGFTLYYEHRYRTQSNRESGYGRFDLAMFPKKANLPGVLLEFKAAETPDALRSSAAEAFTQIADKSYLTEFRAQNVTDVWCYGIAFCGKQVMIKNA